MRGVAYYMKALKKLFQLLTALVGGELISDGLAPLEVLEPGLLLFTRVGGVTGGTACRIGTHRV